MPSKLIRLQENILVEVETTEDQIQKIAGGIEEKVNATFDKVQNILSSICKPFAYSLSTISDNIQVEKAEIEVGLSFEVEGNIFITKAKSGANLNVKITLIPK